MNKLKYIVEKEEYLAYYNVPFALSLRFKRDRFTGELYDCEYCRRAGVYSGGNMDFAIC